MNTSTHAVPSYARGATDVPLIEQTIGDLFDRIATQHAEREAPVSRHEGRRFTYRELQAECNRLASALLGLGLQTGDRVGIWSHNNTPWVPMQIATAKLGLILVNINPAYRTSGLNYALNKVGCKALVTITIAYGMTETSPVSCQSSTDTPQDKRVTTVGTVQPHLEVKIIDPETGAVVPRGVAGEFLTRGYSVMHGYWGDEARTHEAIDAEQWMHTGDLATMDDEGYVNTVGRIKDLVIRGGENIYPREIEEFLYRHPKIRTCRWSAFPTSVAAKSCAPGSS